MYVFSKLAMLDLKIFVVKCVTAMNNVTWRICHTREHCRSSADNVSHVRMTISCRDLRLDTNLEKIKLIKLNIPFKLTLI